MENVFIPSLKFLACVLTNMIYVNTGAIHGFICHCA